MEDLFIVFYYLAWAFGILSVSTFIADYILPLIPAVNRFIDSLPLMQEDEKDTGHTYHSIR